MLILVVDDEPDNLAVLQWFLADDGFEVRTAASGAEALRSVQAEVPDLAIVDYIMPGMDGVTLCRRLRERPATQRLPIILHTATEPWKLPPPPDLCADRVVAKPGDARDLVNEVRSLLERRH